MADDEASEDRSRSRSTIFDSEEQSPSLGTESHEVQPDAEQGAEHGAQPGALREPLEHTRLSTLECEWCVSKDTMDTEPATLVRYQSPTGTLSWTLAVRFGDPDDDDDTSLRLLLRDVQVERPENLCIKVEARVSTTDLPRAAAKVNTIKKLFRADGELLVVDEATQRWNEMSLLARVSTHYRCPPCGPCADWSRLRAMLELAEVTFLLGDVALPAHKQVLCARSPVFRSMFTLGFKEAKEMVVNVEEARPEAFDKFLEYLYSGQVQDFEQMELQVMLIADRYQVEDLKVLCQREMFDKVNTSNVLETLVLADKVNAQLLKKNALSVAVDKIGAVMASPTWKHFHREHNELVDDMLKEATLKNVTL